MAQQFFALRAAVTPAAPIATVNRTAPMVTVTPAATLGQAGPGAKVLPAARGRQHLPPALATAVREIMHRRDLRTGDVMREIGRKPLDASLGRALHRGTQIQEDLVVALEKWVAENKAP